jgi:hypothetical protein
MATYGYLFSFYTLLPVATRWQPFGVWDRMGCETRTYDTHEIFAGTTGFARQSSCQCSPQKIIVALCWFCFFTYSREILPVESFFIFIFFLLC